MTWFKVDDSFHSHPKVLMLEPAALGLWVVAGAWSSANLTDGFVPERALPRLLPDSASLAEELVTAGLWKRTRGGFLFHDWQDYNPTAVEVKADREAARERMRKLRSDRKKPGSNTDRSGEQSRTSGERSDDVRNPVPSRPVPSSPEGTRTDTGSQSVLPRNARRPEDDDDSIDSTIVQLLAELTGRKINTLWAAKVRAGILGERSVKNRLAYITTAIHERPRDFLPHFDSNAGDGPPLRAAPEWCGSCSPATRQLELADDTVARCPACHPLEWRSA